MREMASALPPKFKTLWRHCSALSDNHYWVGERGLGDATLEDDMRAAAHVVHGGMLQKFRKSGREKPHRRFVRLTGGSLTLSGRRTPVELLWDKKGAEVVRADDEVYESCFQGGAKPEDPGCFQVILDKRMVFLLADTAEEKAIWVRGINALVGRNFGQLRRDDERLGAEVVPDEHGGDWVAVVDNEAGSVYLRDYASADEYWILSDRRDERADVRAERAAHAAHATRPQGCERRAEPAPSWGV